MPDFYISVWENASKPCFSMISFSVPGSNSLSCVSSVNFLHDELKVASSLLELLLLVSVLWQQREEN